LIIEPSRGTTWAKNLSKKHRDATLSYSLVFCIICHEVKIKGCVCVGLDRSCIDFLLIVV
jgi:hypothetical protein